MRLKELIEQLERELREHGDIEVMLTVTNYDRVGREVQNHGDVTSVTVEQNHGTEDLFVRIAGDDEE